MQLKTGQEFGTYIYTGLTTNIRPYSQKKIPLRCQCGKVTEVRIASVTTGKSKTCGKCTSFVLKNGTKFGELEYVGKDVETQKESQKKLLFKCGCGREKMMRAFTVFRERAKKCGNCNAIDLFPGFKIGVFTYVGSGEKKHLGSIKKALFSCEKGHVKYISLRSVKKVKCLECSIIRLNPTDVFGNFRYVGKYQIDIRPHSKKKILLRCRCGVEKEIPICSVSNGDVVSCADCYSKIIEWFKNNEEFLRSMKCPINPVDIPSGGTIALQAIVNKVECFDAVCPACKGIYRPRFNDIRRGKCLTCGCVGKRISAPAREIFEYIQSLGLDVEFEHKIDNRLFDVYVPKHRMAIELNGNRWHSKPESKTRDFAKYVLAKQNGIGLISIFEDEWKKKKEIMKAIIRNRLMTSSPRVIRPSTCDIGKINSSDAGLFYDRFHYIGRCASKVHYGARFNGVLIGCVSFRRPSRTSKYDFELSRMAADPEWRIHGLWGSMMSRFIKEFSPLSIVSFSDNRLFSGKTYEKIGFTFDGDVKPDYYWVKGNKRSHKSALRKPPGCDVTETELRESQGYRKIWDLGKKRWVWKSRLLSSVI